MVVSFPSGGLLKIVGKGVGKGSERGELLVQGGTGLGRDWVTREVLDTDGVFKVPISPLAMGKLLLAGGGFTFIMIGS